jgi:hypothetical protein
MRLTQRAYRSSTHLAKDLTAATRAAVMERIARRTLDKNHHLLRGEMAARSA